jgi:hypothetical protein
MHRSDSFLDFRFSSLDRYWKVVEFLKAYSACIVNIRNDPLLGFAKHVMHDATHESAPVLRVDSSHSFLAMDCLRRCDAYNWLKQMAMQPRTLSGYQGSNFRSILLGQPVPQLIFPSNFLSLPIRERAH